MNYTINQILKKVLQKWYIVIATVIIMAGVGYGLTPIFAKAEYTNTGAFSTMPFFNKDGINITTDIYMNVTKSTSVLEAVVNDTDVKKYNIELSYLVKNLEVVQEGNIIRVTLKSDNSERNNTIIQSYLTVGLNEIKLKVTFPPEVPDSINDKLVILDNATESDKSIDKSIILVAVMMLIGLLVSCFIIALPYIFNRVDYDSSILESDFETLVLAEFYNEGEKK